MKLWSKQSSVTRVGSPSQSWLDDYFSWSATCCKMNSTGHICQEDDTQTEDEDDGGFDYSNYYGQDYEYGSNAGEEEDFVEEEICKPCSNG